MSRTEQDAIRTEVAASIVALALPVAMPTAADASDGFCRDYSGLPKGDGPHAGMVWIKGGSFTMGSAEHHPEERAPHEVTVGGPPAIRPGRG